MPKFRRCAFFPAVILPLALALFCGKGSNNPAAAQENGMLEIRARVANKALAKSGAAAETAANRLVVEITAADMDTMRAELKLDPARPSVGDTVRGIPPGGNRKVAIWAIDKNGAVTHIDSAGNRAVTIENAKVTLFHSTLIPAAGSIYLQINGLPAKTKVYASFTALDNTLIAENTVKRETRTFVNLDNIPHNATGILTVAVIDTSDGKTTHIANDTLTFNARANNTINLQFTENSAMLQIDVDIYTPGVTVGSYDFGGKSASVVDETGEAIITEIMWNAGNDNYIELYNPGDTAVFFNTLTTDVDGTTRDFDSVTIASKGYLVIGRQNLPHFDIYTTTTGGLPITSTGNWITVKRGKDGAVIDRVICAGNNSAMGWPPVSGKRSIELARDKYSAAANDYGKNWSAAEEFISDESSQYGTPGR